MGTVRMPLRNRIAIVILTLLSILYLFWPIYRSFLKIEVDVNEGWNAYFADAAMGRMPLYPSRDQLITNNYPPLSFYITGLLGYKFVDPVQAGRFISIISVIMIGVGTFLCLKQYAVDSTSAFVGSLFFIATMARFFTSYVGMNDPHLLAQAVMTLGFLLFLRAQKSTGSYYLAILVMVVAGFMKHNLIVMPLACLITVGLQNRRAMISAAIFATVTIAMGFAACYFAYGSDFLANLFAPRVTKWKEAISSIGHLQWVAVGLVFWCYVGFKLRAEPAVRMVNLLVLLGLASFFLQKTGEGVSYNAQFELVFAVSLAVGLTFAYAEKLPLAPRSSPDAIRFALLLAIIIRLLASGRMEPVRVLFDREFHAEIAERERAMDVTVERYRSTPHAIGTTSIASYRAGVPYYFDAYTTGQRIRKGQLTEETVKAILENPNMARVPEEPLSLWMTPYQRK